MKSDAIFRASVFSHSPLGPGLKSAPVAFLVNTDMATPNLPDEKMHHAPSTDAHVEGRTQTGKMPWTRGQKIKSTRFYVV